MKKILTIFLTITLLLLTPLYIYAQDTVTEESTVEEDVTTTEEDTSTTLSETLEEDVDTGISVWTVLFAIVGASFFLGIAYMVLKNFNL